MYTVWLHSGCIMPDRPRGAVCACGLQCIVDWPLDVWFTDSECLVDIPQAASLIAISVLKVIHIYNLTFIWDDVDLDPLNVPIG